MASNMDVSALVAEVYKAAGGRDSRLSKATNISSDIAKALIREIGNKAENENSTEAMLAKAAVVFDREFGAPKVAPVVKPQVVTPVVTPVVKPQAITPVVTTHMDVAALVAEVYKAAGGRDSRLSKAAKISSDVAKALIREIGNKAENENSTEAMLAKAAVVFDREFGAPKVTPMVKPQAITPVVKPQAVTAVPRSSRASVRSDVPCANGKGNYKTWYMVYKSAAKARFEASGYTSSEVRTKLAELEPALRIMEARKIADAPLNAGEISELDSLCAEVFHETC